VGGDETELRGISFFDMRKSCDLKRVNLLHCYGVSLLINSLSLPVSVTHRPAAHQAKQPPLGTEVPQAVPTQPPLPSLSLPEGTETSQAVLHRKRRNGRAKGGGGGGGGRARWAG
jgi:hypothetical protein